MHVVIKITSFMFPLSPFFIFQRRGYEKISLLETFKSSARLWDLFRKQKENLLEIWLCNPPPRLNVAEGF